MPLSEEDQMAAALRGEMEGVVRQMDLNACPRCGGEADRGHSRDVPPVPYFCTKCTGSKWWEDRK